MESPAWPLVRTGQHGFADQTVARTHTHPVLARLAEGGGLVPVLLPETDALRRIIVEPARLAGLANFTRHFLLVASVAFSPDGSRIVSGSWDRTVKVWDASTGKELASFTEHSDLVKSVAFSPDGSRIAAGSKDKTVKVWDASTGKELASLTGHSNEVTSVAFSPDGSRIASGSWDRTVKVWDAATGKELANFTGYSSGVTSVAFSPDGSRIVSGSWDETVKVWDASTGKELASLAGHSDGVTSVAFSPDGSRIASGSEDHTVKVWDASTGKELASLTGHSDGVTSVAFSPDGSRIASGSEDHTVKVWDASTGKELTSLTGHSDGVTRVAFSRDGGRLASGSEDQTVKVWDAATGKELANFTGHSSPVTSVAFSPDGGRIASESWDQTVKVWDAATGKELAGRPDFPLNGGVAFSPDMKLRARPVKDEIWLESNAPLGHPDLMHFQRQNLLLLQGRDFVAPPTNSSLFSEVSFTPLFMRKDELAALATTGLSESRRYQLRLQLLAKVSNWRATLAFWRTLDKPDAATRRTLCDVPALPTADGPSPEALRFGFGVAAGDYEEPRCHHWGRSASLPAADAGLERGCWLDAFRGKSARHRRSAAGSARRPPSESPRSCARAIGW